jgi:hypothetical protein
MVTEYVIPEIHGIKEALAELNSFDRVYRRQVTKDIQRAGVKIISAARELIPSFANKKGNGAPLSGMVRGSMIKGRDVRWSNERVRDGFKIKVGQAKRKADIVQFAGKDKVFFKGTPYQVDGHSTKRRGRRYLRSRRYSVKQHSICRQPKRRGRQSATRTRHSSRTQP